MSRTRRSLTNYFVGLSTSFVAPVVGLVATPFLLRHLGDVRFGAYRTAQDWCGYAGLLGLGVTGALQPLLVDAIHRPGPSAVPHLFAAAFRAYLRVALLMVATILALAVLAPRLIQAPSDLDGELRAGILTSLASFVWLPFAAFRVLADAEQRAWLVHSLLVVQALVTTAAAVLFAWAGFGLVGQFLAPVLGAAPFALGLARYGVRRHPGLLSARSRPEDRRALLRLHGPSLAWNLARRVELVSDSLVIAAILGVEAVVPFGITQRLPLMAQLQVIALGGASWAALSELRQQGLQERFVARLLELTRYTAILASAALVPIAVANRAFVALWVGDDRYGGDSLTWLTVGVGFGQSLLAFWGWPLIAGGLVRTILPGALVGVGVNLTVGILCTSSLGITGTAVGTLAGFAAIHGWYVPRLLRRELGVPLRGLVRAVLVPLALALAYTAALLLLARVLPPDAPDASRAARWVRLLAWLGVAGAGYLALALAIVLSRSERAEWTARLRRLRGARA